MEMCGTLTHGYQNQLTSCRQWKDWQLWTSIHRQICSLGERWTCPLYIIYTISSIVYCSNFRKRQMFPLHPGTLFTPGIKVLMYFTELSHIIKYRYTLLKTHSSWVYGALVQCITLFTMHIEATSQNNLYFNSTIIISSSLYLVDWIGHMLSLVPGQIKFQCQSQSQITCLHSLIIIISYCSLTCPALSLQNHVCSLVTEQ